MNHRPIFIVSFLAVFAGAGNVAAQEQAAPVQSARLEGPRLQWSETVHDFGKVKASDTLRHEFVVSNTGTAVLEITSVVPACGCTVPGAWDRTIQPGKTGKIGIEFSPGNFNGNVSKSIEVTSNDPAQPKHTLEIRALVMHPVEIRPPHVYFAPIEGEESSETKSVEIISRLDEPLTLELPQSESLPFQFKLEEKVPGKEFALHVTHAGRASSVAQYREVELKSSSLEVPSIKVRVYATPQPGVALVPNIISIPSPSSGDKFQHVQMVLNNSSETIAVTGATFNAEGVTTEIAEVRPGKLFTVKMDFPPGFEPQRGHRLAIQTSHPKYREVIVPVAKRGSGQAVQVPVTK